jgi:hypothetical protein
MAALDNRPLSEIFREAGESWAEKEFAAQLLEDTKSAVMAQRQTELGDIPVNRAEQIVKASPEWVEHIEKIAVARCEANMAKINMEVVRMKYGEWNSREANVRQELKMTA